MISYKYLSILVGLFFLSGTTVRSQDNVREYLLLDVESALAFTFIGAHIFKGFNNLSLGLNFNVNDVPEGTYPFS